MQVNHNEKHTCPISMHITEQPAPFNLLFNLAIRPSLLPSVSEGPFEEGIFLVNISPARMDFRSLVTPAQATAVMDLIEGRWEEWIGEMPLKITYPALEGHEWRIVTG
ncbi:hypothetical protein KY290_025748 [Solanum tuberosum]|uniref:Beta-fructofuranosidase n=1 Tax=Solanum tuberosum TaxID=4113 RepID=A0ABQ7UUJ8_SOLTU|nr:hypothetical protein KY285_024575 [Solanum tuberosum]KAH0755478.1 hypothetical protein KY290_025748 [Solanum tuberosum]